MTLFYFRPLRNVMFILLYQFFSEKLKKNTAAQVIFFFKLHYNIIPKIHLKRSQALSNQ